MYELAVQSSRYHCSRDMLGHPQPAAAAAAGVCYASQQQLKHAQTVTFAHRT